MKTVGIDLGTTNSSVSYHDGHGAVPIELLSGSATLPSVVGFDSAGRLLVGAMAAKGLTKDQRARFTFSNIKRHIGLPFRDGEDYGSQIVKGPDGLRWFQGPDRAYSAAELSAEILKVLKATAEQYLGGRVDGAVITVPAGFDNNRVAATMEAGKLAGFKKVHPLPEPQAATLAYGLDKQKLLRTAVVDMGGGTFDIVIADVARGLFKMRSKNGWDRLGGVDFDNEIISLMIDRYHERTGDDLRDKDLTLLKMAPRAETAKRELTEMLETVFEAENVAWDAANSIMNDISEPVTREQFEKITAHLTGKAIEITDRAMADADRSAREIDAVLMVGGMTRVPAVRKAFADYFGEKKLNDSISPTLAVCLGAAAKAAEIDGRIANRLNVADVTGAAFGLEVEGAKFAQVLPKGSPPDMMQSVVLTNAAADMEVLPVAILQGEETRASANTVLARYDVPLDKGPEESAKIRLDFMLDENGLLMVTGKDLTKDEASFTILERG